MSKISGTIYGIDPR